MSFGEETRPAAPPGLVDAVLPHAHPLHHHRSAQDVDAPWYHLTLDQLIVLASREAKVELPPSLIELAATWGKAVFTTDVALPQRAAYQAFKFFAEALGSTLGDVALTLNATGGVYLMGEDAIKLYNLLHASNFRTFFQAKGAAASYLATLPVWVILHPAPTFVGLARTVWEQDNF